MDKKEKVKEKGEWTKLKLDNNTVTGYTVPIGPFHPALLEGEFFKLKVDGERVVDADIKLGYNYRGIMKLAESRSYWRDLYLIERVCGICSHAHTTCYTRTVEMLGKIEVPDRARFIRTLVAELERIHSHLLWAGIGMELIGFRTLFMYIWREREHVLDILEMISGNRQHYAMNTIGGVRRDVQKDMIPKIMKKISEMKKSLMKLVEVVVRDPIIRNRTVNVGKLDKDIARKICVVGPVARSVGIKIDVRKDDPYAAYEEVPFDIVTAEDGDVFSMIEVRLREVIESIKICEYCLDVLTRIGGDIRTEVSEFPVNETVGRVEAPRGELMYYIVSNGTHIPERVRIRTPSYMNDYAILFMLKDQALADAPIIIAAVDPCMACTDRMIHIEDAKSNKKEIISVYELSRRYRRKEK